MICDTLVLHHPEQAVDFAPVTANARQPFPGSHWRAF